MGLAERLAGRGSGPGRPRTVDLRRAVSTAYYGLFHGWTWAAAAGLLEDPDDDRVSAVARWISHSDILELSKAVLLANGSVTRNKVNAARHIEPVLMRPIGEDVVGICRSFARVQEERHKADYDRDYMIHRRAALEIVDEAGQAWRTLWRLQSERDSNIVLLLRLSFGATRVARTY